VASGVVDAGVDHRRARRRVAARHDPDEEALSVERGTSRITSARPDVRDPFRRRRLDAAVRVHLAQALDDDTAS
jgi:hypothetical protein